MARKVKPTGLQSNGFRVRSVVCSIDEFPRLMGAAELVESIVTIVSVTCVRLNLVQKGLVKERGNGIL